MLDMVFTITSVKLLALYLLLNGNKVFLHGRLPPTLLDIESEIVYYVSKKNIQSVWFKAIKSAVHVYSESSALNQLHTTQLFWQKIYFYTFNVR